MVRFYTDDTAPKSADSAELALRGQPYPQVPLTVSQRQLLMGYRHNDGLKGEAQEFFSGPVSDLHRHVLIHAFGAVQSGGLDDVAAARHCKEAGIPTGAWGEFFFSGTGGGPLAPFGHVPAIVKGPDPGWEEVTGPPEELAEAYADLVRQIIDNPQMVRDLTRAQESLLVLGQSLDMSKLQGIDPPPRDQVIEGVLDRGDVCLLAAPSKAGKSLFALGLALAAADGNEFCGLRFGPKRRVFIFDNELSREAIQKRAARMDANQGAQDRACWVVPLRSTRLRLAAHELAGMAGLLRECQADLLVLDCAYRFYPEDGVFNENSNADIARFMGWVSEFAMAAGMAVILVHHAGKDSGVNRSAIDYSAGAGAFARAPRALMNIRHLHIRGDKKLPQVPVLEIVASNYPAPPPRVLYLDSVNWRLRRPGDPLPMCEDDSELWGSFSDDIPTDGPPNQLGTTRKAGADWQSLWNQIEAILAKEGDTPERQTMSANGLANALHKVSGHPRDRARDFVTGLARHGYLREGEFGLLRVNPQKPFSPDAYEVDEVFGGD